MVPLENARIAVVGAGTAGLASAIALARCGFAVEVFEKHPSLAPLGAGLLIQPQGLLALAELGVSSAFNQVSVPIERLTGHSHKGWKLVDIAYDDGGARAVGRPALSAVLYQEALRLGVTVNFSAEISAVRVAGQEAVLCFNGRSRVYDLVVLAEGAASKLAPALDLATPATPYPWGALWGLFEVDNWPGAQVLEQRYQSTEKMFGLMPTGRANGKLTLSLFWSLRQADYAAWKKSSLEDWKQQLLALWPESSSVVEQIQSHGQLSFASYRQARARTLARPPICLVGDAAHSMSPQLGLGTTLAVQDALLLARAIAAYGLVQGPLAYSKKRFFSVKAYQTLSKALTPCFQRDGGGLWRDVLFASSLRMPGVKRLMYRSIAEPRKCTEAFGTELPSR